MEDVLKVGVISSTHGVRGEVKIFPTTDDPKRYSSLSEVILGEGDDATILHVAGVKYFKNMVIAKFKEYDSLNSVEHIKGKNLYVRRENAIKLSKDEYFISDLIGLTCIDEEKDMKGELVDVIETGANDVYVINLSDGRELLLPAIRACIIKVDFDNNKMLIHILDGLLD